MRWPPKPKIPGSNPGTPVVFFHSANHGFVDDGVARAKFNHLLRPLGGPTYE